LAGALLEHLVEKPPKPGAIEAFDAAVDAMAAAARDGRALEDLAAADLDIVRALLSATGSTVLVLCMNPVINVISGSAGLRAALYGDPATNVIAWRALGAWLRDPRPEGLGLMVRVVEEHDRQSVLRLRRKRTR
ncbi:MAG: FCD domain-containing protein, partial [Myxococcota bacterium]|nr:FCD domain-containing protein [Myxococcota bacterium]